MNQRSAMSIPVATKILILENQMMIATKVSQQFSRLGYNVIGVINNFEVALDTIGINHPDIVMMNIDIRYEVKSLKIAKSILETFLIPVIFINPNAFLSGNQAEIVASPDVYSGKALEDKKMNSVEILHPSSNRKSLFIPQKGLFIKIAMDDLLFVEAKRNACQLSTESHLYHLSVPLKAIEDQLPEDLFVRIHRSFLVNLQKITAVDSHGSHLVIQNHKLPISRRLKAKVLQYIGRL